MVEIQGERHASPPGTRLHERRCVVLFSIHTHTGSAICSHDLITGAIAEQFNEPAYMYVT